MAFQGYEAATGILQDMYKGMISNVYEEMSPLFKVIKPKSDKVFGQQVKFSAQLENPQGVASRATASQAIPSAVPGKYIELVVGTGRVYAVLEFDGKMLKAAGQNKEGKLTYVNYLENEMKGLKTSLNLDLGRQLFGSQNGFLSLMGVTANALVAVLDAAANMQYFIEGMVVDIVVTTTGIPIAAGTARTIVAVDPDAQTITLDNDGGAVTTDATMSIVKNGAYNAEMIGLPQIISDTADIYGIVTAQQRRWRSYVYGTGFQFTLKQIGKIALAAKIRSGVWTDLIVSSPGKMQQLADYLKGTNYNWDIGKTPKPPETLATGYNKINVLIEGNLMEWISDPNCPDDVIYGIRKEFLGIQHLGDPEFININGEILLPNIYGANGTDTFKAVLAYYPQFVCQRRNPHWVASSVSDMAGW